MFNRLLLFSFLYFLFSAYPSFSQSRKLSFWRLSCPEKWWVVSHPFVANKAKKVTKSVLQVTEEIKKDSVLDGDNNGGQVDAFRHAFWMASLSQKFSSKKALALGKAHEKGNYKSFKKGKPDEEGALPDSVAGAMDLFNNGIGATIGSGNKNMNSDSLKVIVCSMIREGKMKIISKDENENILDCSGNVVEVKLYLNVWGVPKCLVGSDTRKSK